MSILPEDFSKYHTDANLALVLAELRPALASSIGALVELDRGPPNKRLSTRSEIKWGNPRLPNCLHQRREEGALE